MDFGRSVLEKYGWKEGKGLGTNEDGLVNAIQVKGFFGYTGLGHDMSKQFTSQWWDHIYNKTADNIDLEKSEDGSLQVTRKQEHKLTQKMIPYSNASSVGYKSSFVKAGTQDKVEEKDMTSKLSYDELFKICGGRTVHKGARHGIKMSAKLARVQEQERELMAKWKKSEDKKNLNCCEPSIEEPVKKSKKKKRQSTEDESSHTESQSINIVDESSHLDSPSSKKKKKKKAKDHEQPHTENENVTESFQENCLDLPKPVSDNMDIENIKLSKKERKRLAKAMHLENVNDPDAQTVDKNAEITVKRKKKKKKDKDRGNEDIDGEVMPSNDENVNLINIPSLDEDTHLSVKHKKKKKKDKDRVKDYSESEVIPFDEVTLVNSNIEKPKKKKKKDKDRVKDDSEGEGIPFDSNIEQTKKKKKKKDKDRVKEDSEGEERTFDDSNTEQPKRKKKKKDKDREKDHADSM